jgi:MFS family permease
MSTMTQAASGSGGLTKNEKFVILASSLGTMFEWYDFFIYAVLTPFFATLFFPPGNPTWALLGALGAYAAGFIVRPFGAVFFGRLGDMIGRKTTFLVTITVMGLATFCIGLLPGYASIGVLAPVLLLIIRMLQGLAIGGEYGGAATYVAEHSQNGRRGYTTSWIQTTATLGLLLALVIVYAMRSYDPVWFAGKSGSFAGWRIPFVGSILLLAFSLYIRMKLNESPVFEKMKAEGRGSPTPFRDSFFKSPNNKIVLLSFLGAVMAQAVIWYTAQFYALFFISGPLKANWDSTYWIIGWSIALATPFFIVFGALSDRIGRKPIVIAGSFAAAVLIFPLFHMLSGAVNPALDKFNADNGSKIVVTADPAQCHFTVIPIPTVSVSGDCDRAKGILTSNGIQFVSMDGAAGSKVTLDANGNKVEGENAFAWTAALAKAGYPNMAFSEGDVTLTKDQTDALVKAQTDKKPADIAKVINDVRIAADPKAAVVAATNSIGAPTVAADGTSTVHVSEVKTSLAKESDISYSKAIFAVFALMVLATMTYGPIAAWLVELFPTNIRYTSMSLPYHMGNGVVGGLLPLTATAWVAYSGNVYQGLWYPVIFCVVGGVIGLFFLKETKDVDIATHEYVL